MLQVRPSFVCGLATRGTLTVEDLWVLVTKGDGRTLDVFLVGGGLLFLCRCTEVLLDLGLGLNS